jgi:hypothetical protein
MEDAYIFNEFHRGIVQEPLDATLEPLLPYTGEPLLMEYLYSLTPSVEADASITLLKGEGRY